MENTKDAGAVGIESTPCSTYFMKTDTPLTDAEIESSVLENKNHPHTDWVTASFARGLEREISGLNDALKIANRSAESECAKLRSLMVRIYNSGYHAGHHDTVEAGYVDIHDCDMDTYHAETVEDILSNSQDR